MSTNNSKAFRFAGALFSTSMLALIVIVPLYLFVYGQPEGTGSNGSITDQDYATHLLQKWDFASTKWKVELVALAMLVVSSFLLSNRQSHDDSWISGRIAWNCIATGGLIAIPMYLIILGGYSTAARDIEINPTLFPVLRGIATVTFAFGNTVIYLGLSAVFWSTRGDKLIPSWLVLIGVVSSLATSLILFLLLFGIGSLQMAGPTGLASYVVGAILGIAICRNR